MKKKLLFLFWIAAAACGTDRTEVQIDSVDARAATEKPNALPIGRWDGPVTILLDETMTDDFEDALRSAAETWNSALGWEILRIGGRTESAEFSTLYEGLADDVNGIYQTKEWEKSTGKKKTTLASTIWQDNVVGKRMTSDIIFNTETYTFIDVSEQERMGGAETSFDAESVILHELGHLLGLDHAEDDKESVMYPYMVSLAQKRTLTERDGSAIRTHYER